MRARTMSVANQNPQAVLQARYRAKLVELARELDGFRESSDLGNPARRKEIGRLAHRLYGNGKTFGFAAVTDAAAVLERAIEQSCAQQDIGAAAGLLAAACRDAGSNAGVTVAVGPGTGLLVSGHHRRSELLAAALAGDLSIQISTRLADALAFLAAHSVSAVIVDLMAGGLPAVHLQTVMAAAGPAAAVVLVPDRRQAVVARAVVDRSVKIVIATTEDALAKDVQEALKPAHQRVMLADDDDLVRELLRVRFEARGFVVDTAGNGEAALALLCQRTPDIIVLDRAMPGMDGLELLQIIKRNAELYRVPVLMLSAYAAQQQINQARVAGVEAYMAKPFSPDAVVQRCKEILRETSADLPVTRNQNNNHDRVLK
jgi:two-component system, OmpR family, response regulator MtrA